MKKLIVTTIFLLSISYAFTQQSEKNSASFSLGDGIFRLMKAIMNLIYMVS